jgi:hypothetical protein
MRLLPDGRRLLTVPYSISLRGTIRREGRYRLCFLGKRRRARLDQRTRVSSAPAMLKVNKMVVYIRMANKSNQVKYAKRCHSSGTMRSAYKTDTSQPTELSAKATRALTTIAQRRPLRLASR